MIAFIKKFRDSIKLASDLRAIASRYAGQPERMQECMREALRRDLAETRAASSDVNTEGFGAVTA